MTPDDVEIVASDLERAARSRIRSAKLDLDAATWHRHAANADEQAAAHHMGIAAGLFYRASELRYDARGGMTEALERRRLEPGARWTTRWSDGIVHTVWRREERPEEVRIHFDNIWPSSSELMTRANGWLFLGLSDQGGYR